MDKLYLVFDNQESSNSALEGIYANMVESVNSPDLLNVETGEVINKDELTPDEVVQINAKKRYFPVFGVNAASYVKDLQQGYTTAWAVAQETAQGKWVFAKPDDALLEGVTGYTVAPYDPTWFQVPQIES